ncbi:hypothetical protein, partial [Nostoc linckia]|uniref:hypothetical protein n=1 Tax=Nostoc linckia TaxID=92942 RepID=UPI0015D4E064
KSTRPDRRRCLPLSPDTYGPTRQATQHIFSPRSHPAASHPAHPARYALSPRTARKILQLP